MAANSRFAVALHALAMIAVHHDEPLSSREIAQSVSTNPVVIRRLLAQLARAGLVGADHGARGGFKLARPAARIRLYDVYHAVGEGPFFAIKKDSNEKCPLACRMKDILNAVFSRVESKVVPELKRSTLAGILDGLPDRS